MRIQIFTLLILLSVGSHAQQLERQVITGGGADLVQPGCRISFTLGELCIATATNDQLILTQGFQQPLSAGLNALPVQLVFFTAFIREGQTQLSWKTAQEYNTDHFEIERSVNGTQFTTLTTVASKGNSHTPVLYQATDPVPYAPLTYYRLKIVDKDLRFVYSPMVIIKKELTTGFSLFPNPAADNLVLSVNVTQKATDTWQLTALNGQQAAIKQVVLQQGLNSIQWNISHLPAGTYIVRSANNTFPALKFIKQ